MLIKDDYSVASVPLPLISKALIKKRYLTSRLVSVRFIILLREKDYYTFQLIDLPK
jgi:hypothetical protein